MEEEEVEEEERYSIPGLFKANTVNVVNTSTGQHMSVCADAMQFRTASTARKQESMRTALVHGVSSL